MWCLRKAIGLLPFCFFVIAAFPQGAPVESCDSMLPRHELLKPSPPEKSPYRFIASADHYSYSTIPGITVEILGAPFKGFFVAAIDPHTTKRIGSWKRVKGSDPLPCSAITHVDPYPKSHVTLLWEPPRDRGEGDVIFLATIAESYYVYYTGQVAAVPVPTDGDFNSLFKK
ncbi:putative defense protein 1 [Tachypleus tridentatus]|uniref:putative defense protein 1 n=1 Tax=Tachypleus tridentatus TaxID=6853 RepID=UPI003FD6BBA5